MGGWVCTSFMQGTFQGVPVAIKEYYVGGQVAGVVEGFFKETHILARARHKFLVNFVGVSTSPQGALCATATAPHA